MQSNINIYRYDDPALYLHDVWLHKKGNRAFSIRSWAQHLGIKSGGTFHQILTGKRGLPKKYLPVLTKNLKLDDKESQYLETLIDYKKEKDSELKNYYANKLVQLSRGQSLKIKEVQSFEFFKNPLCFAILEMTSLKDFKDDPKWIQEHLKEKLPLHEIRKMLHTLIDLELLKVDANGYLIRGEQNFYSKQDIKDLALREYHKSIGKLATKALDEQEVFSREFGAAAFGIKKEDLPQIKKEIRSFIQFLMMRFEKQNQDADEIYQFAGQFFSLTNMSKNEEKK